MLTFALQCLNFPLLIVAAVLALSTATMLNSAGNLYHSAAWRLTGMAFLVHGSAIGLQNAWGGAALAAGEGSRIYEAYISWLPVMNQSRTPLITGLMVGLIALALLRQVPDRRFWRFAYGLLIVGLGIGAVVGFREGSFSDASHFSGVAVLDVIELLIVFLALFALLITNRADRLLWAFLAVYSVGLALGVFWFTLLAQMGLPGTWQPRFWTLSAMRLVTVVLMLALVIRRRSLARKGQRVPGMLQPRVEPMPMLR